MWEGVGVKADEARQGESQCGKGIGVKADEARQGESQCGKG